MVVLLRDNYRTGCDITQPVRAIFGCKTSPVSVPQIVRSPCAAAFLADAVASEIWQRVVR